MRGLGAHGGGYSGSGKAGGLVPNARVGVVIAFVGGIVRVPNVDEFFPQSCRQQY